MSTPIPMAFSTHRIPISDIDFALVLRSYDMDTVQDFSHPALFCTPDPRAQKSTRSRKAIKFSSERWIKENMSSAYRSSAARSPLGMSSKTMARIGCSSGTSDRRRLVATSRYYNYAVQVILKKNHLLYSTIIHVVGTTAVQLCTQLYVGTSMGTSMGTSRYKVRILPVQTLRNIYTNN